MSKTVKRDIQLDVMEGPNGGTPQPATGSRAYLYQNVEGPGGGTQPALAQRYQDMEKAQAAPAQLPAPQAQAAPQATAQQPIQVMQGVTEGTRNKLNQLDQGYQPGAAAQQALEQLQQIQANKPGAYTSQYTQQMQGILQSITNPKPFSYSANQDALIQSLSDYYQQQAKQASLNAQGQAAALTGGYGNTAAQAAGSQAYQQAILPMYDKIMDAAQFAYNVHQGEQNNRMNQLNALMAMDENEYGRHRDTVGDYERERDYLAGRYDTEANRNMQLYQTELDYALKRAQIENADYRSEQERQEAIRQFDLQYQADMERFGWQKDVDQRDYNRGVLESDRAYNRDVLESDRSYDMAQQQFNWQQDVDRRNYDRDVLESDRAYDLNRQQFDWQQATDQRDFNEQRRRADQDEAYRQRQLEESMRQFQESMEWDKLSTQQKYNFETAMQILANGQMPSETLLAAAGLNAEDAQKLMAQTTSGGSGSGNGKKNVYYLDKNGNPYKQNSDGSFQAVDPSTLTKDDQFVENADPAIGISGLVTGVKNMVGNNKDLINKLLGKGK